jgi:hypothetical protein
MEKKCPDCGITKPLTLFYRHKKMADGHLNKCMECVKARVRKHRAENLERVQAYDRLRGLLPHRKAGVKARAHRYKEQHALAVKAAYRAEPQKRAARIAVGNALRDGRIKAPQACSRCLTVGRVEAHHEDYSKPFDVVWLCTSCHGLRHREINEERRKARRKQREV